MTQKHQQLTKEERDYQFSAVCYTLRESLVGGLSNDQLDTLDSALEELDITLPNCSVRGGNIIFFAISTYSPAVIKYLLDNGASALVRNHKGQTPLDYAKSTLEEIRSVTTADSLMVVLAQASVDLLQSIEDENNSREKEHGFIELCYSLRERLTHELTDGQRAQLNHKFSELSHNLNDLFLYQVPPIFDMITAHSPAIVDFFIQKGAYLGVRNHSKQTPLEYAEGVLAETKSLRSEGSHMIALAEETVEILKKHQI